MKTWDDVVANLELSGAAGQAVQQSMLIGWETKTHIVLLLGYEYRLLATSAIQEKIAAALEKTLGHKVTVEIQVQKEIPKVLAFTARKKELAQ